MDVDGFSGENSEGSRIHGKGWWNLDRPDALAAASIFESDWGEQLFIGGNNCGSGEIAGDSE